MSSKFKYRETSAETVSARAKQSGGSYDSYVSSTYSFWKVKEGQNDCRLLPPTWDVDGPWGDNWGIEIYLHRDIGPDKGAYLCLDKMREKYGSKLVPNKLGACPLCAARHDVEDDDEAAKALKPGKQILALIIDRNAEKDGPQVWRMGWQMERDIQIRSQDKKTGAVIQITHPDNGYDLSFNREGAGLKTKYVGIDIARDESPVAEKQKTQDKWLDFLEENPLTEQLVFFDADYLDQVYMGKKSAKGGNAEDEEEDDRNTRRPARTARSARQAEPEEEAPPPRRRAAAPAEEDEPPPRKRPARGEEEEADEPPPRRGRSAEPDEEEDRPRGRRAVAEADDEPPPRRRAAAREREEDDDRLPTDAEMRRNSARLAARPAEEDEPEDAPPPRRRAAAPAEEDDDPAPQPRRRPAARAEAEEEEEDPPARGKPADKAKAALGRLQSSKL